MVLLKEKIREIASRIKELRELSGISAEDMSKELNVSVSVYASYENGVEDIPASMLHDIAQKLKVDMGLLLTGEETRMHIFTVTRKGKGVAVERSKEYKYQSLAEKFIHKKAEPMIVVAEPKNKKPEINSHPGQEFDYVLEGTLKVYIHDNELTLNEGDSIFFDSSYGHAVEAMNGKPARFLAVIL